MALPRGTRAAPSAVRPKQLGSRRAGHRQVRHRNELLNAAWLPCSLAAWPQSWPQGADPCVSRLCQRPCDALRYLAASFRSTARSAALARGTGHGSSSHDAWRWESSHRGHIEPLPAGAPPRGGQSSPTIWARAGATTMMRRLADDELVAGLAWARFSVGCSPSPLSIKSSLHVPDAGVCRFSASRYTHNSASPTT